MAAQMTPLLQSGWRGLPPERADDAAFIETLLELHALLFDDHFAGDPEANESLGIEVRAFRRLEGWRVALVLTPWMLARLLIPDRDPKIPLPPEWCAEAREEATYQALGPQVGFSLLGQDQQAHLNYHAWLGHYLIQPIALNMGAYESPEAVFEAWSNVIRTRDENMARHRKDCPWQQEISRRELFSRLRTGGTRTG
jgi:hypothetical protein